MALDSGMMLFRRKLLLAASLVLCGGSVWGSLGYGLYLRSDACRRRVEAEVGAFLGLPTRIGRVYPLTLHSRLARDVRVWLPGSRSEIFHCGQAGWHARSEQGDVRYTLRLRDGAFVIDSSLWTRDDYRLVLESGLAHDFADLRLEQVRVYDLDFTWRRPGFELTTREANGTILFDGGGSGHATLVSHWLNARKLNEPIHIRARFTPDNVVTIHEVQLESPRIPLAAMRLDQILGVKTTQGSFAGKITYREEGDSSSAELSGFVEDVLLGEISRPYFDRPLTGTASLFVDHALATDRMLDVLVVRGMLRGLDLGAFYELFGLPDAGGHAALEVHRVELDNGRIRSLAASGHASGLLLDVICKLLGRGEVTGTLDVNLRSLQMYDNAIASAELDLIAHPPQDRPGTIDGELLKNVVQQLFGIALPDLLPERLEYTDFGAKLLLEGGRLRVLGTHGPNNSAILTVRLFGHDVAVLHQPARSFDVQPYLDRLTAALDQVEPGRVREWTESRVRKGPS